MATTPSSVIGGLSAAARHALLTRLARRREEQDAPPPQPGRPPLTKIPSFRDFGLFHTALAELKITSPYFKQHQGLAGTRSTVDHRDCLNFSSYDYLGLNGDPRLAAAAKAAIDRYGISPSASRLVSGERPIHTELETALAQLHGTEAALAFVSGHATNVTVIGHMMGPRDLILHDATIHNSAAEGARLSGARRLPFAHNDWQAAERELAAARRTAQHALIIIEGHYSMDGDTPDLARFVAIARRHDAWLMVDEAHSIGVLGPTGRGLAEAQQVDPADIDLWMGTLSKTLCASGGYIAGSRALIDWLRHTAPGFVYSVGLPPVLAAAAHQALAILAAEPWRVQRLNAAASRFRDAARAAGFDTGASEGRAIVPIVTGSSVRALRLSAALFDRGVNVQPIIFPAVPEQAARLRFFLSAAHTDADVDATIEALRS